MEFVEPYDARLMRPDGSVTVGVTDTDSKVVSISKGLNPTFEHKVLCHEITHCAMHSYGVELTLEQEELVADLISTYGEEIVEVTNDVFKRLRERVA